MVQRMAALGLAWLCILAAVAGCSRPAEQEAQSQLMAVVLEVYDTSILVEPVEGDEARRSSDRIVAPTEGALYGYAPQVGDRVLIRYDGSTLETYPAQLSEVYSIARA